MSIGSVGEALEFTAMIFKFYPRLLQEDLKQGEASDSTVKIVLFDIWAMRQKGMNEWAHISAGHQ